LLLACFGESERSEGSERREERRGGEREREIAKSVFPLETKKKKEEEEEEGRRRRRGRKYLMSEEN